MSGRTLGVRGTVVPNRFVVSLSPEDIERFAGFRDALVIELADAAREHAREQGYHFEGAVEVDDRHRRGRHGGAICMSRADIVAGTDGMPGTLVLPDGRRVALGDVPAVIGRMPDCAVSLSDPQVSRRHAEVRRDELGFLVVDLDSTNGNLVNGVPVQSTSSSTAMSSVGATSIRYEES